MNHWSQMMGMGHQQHQPQPQNPQMMVNPMALPTNQPPLPQPPKPLLPPHFMVPELGININPAPQTEAPQALIGPVQPDNMTTEDMALSDDEKSPAQNPGSKENKNKDANSRERDNRRDSRENRDRDRGRNDQRSRDRGSNSRHDRNDRFNDRNRDRFNDRNKDRNDRNRDRRERRTKWGDSDNNMSDISVMMGMMPDNGGSGMMMGQMGQNMGGMAAGGPGMGGMGPGTSGMGGMGPGVPGMGGMGLAAPGVGGMGPGGAGIMPAGQSMGSNVTGMGGMPQGMSPDDQGMGRIGNGQQGMGGMGSGGQGMGSGGPGMGQGMMPPYHNMQNMPNAGNMQNMPMMPGMNNMMMNNMMDPNMMMMNRTMMMQNQPIYVTDAMLLPPIPGVSMPNRREKPPGCRTIFVGGLPKGVSEQTISEIFQQFGIISDIKIHRQGVCHVRFDKHESVEASFFLSGYRFKTHDQTNNEATTLFVDYALNRDDQNEFERSQRHRPKTPPKIEMFNLNALSEISEKIKSDEDFIQAAPTLIAWLERGECNKRNASAFYGLIQASNNQVRRLFNEKMNLDDEFHTMKSSLREKFCKVVEQFEAVAKILAVGKHQRVSDHFTKQQRRNIEMWFKMTEEVENIKEEFNSMFEDEEIEKCGRNVVPAEKYEQLRVEHENLVHELEGYKNEAYLAKDEAERKFEKFKAHWIAQQALQNKGQGGPQVFPPLPPLPNMAAVPPMTPSKPQPPPPTPDDDKVQTSGPVVPPSEAKLISILTAFLMVHPLGASLDYLVSYVRSMVPNVTQATVHQTLQKYTDVFTRKTSGIGANIEHRWGFNTFDLIKKEAP